MNKLTKNITRTLQNLHINFLLILSCAYSIRAYSARFQEFTFTFFDKYYM